MKWVLILTKCVLVQDLLGKMLQLNKHCRCNAEVALKSKVFSDYHDPDDEPTGEPFTNTLLTHRTNDSASLIGMFPLISLLIITHTHKLYFPNAVNDQNAKPARL